jgi:hypothetical protein
MGVGRYEYFPYATGKGHAYVHGPCDTLNRFVPPVELRLTDRL